MPSSYTTSLRLTLPATGELAGQWGNTVNTGITELLDAAVAGTTTISTWGGAGVAYTLSNNSGTADEARRMFIVATGTPGEAKNVICPAVSKFYVFRNDTTGGFALTLKTFSGTGVSVPAGQYKFLYCDGTNVVEMFNSAGALTLSGALTVNGTTTLASNPTLSAGTANQVQFLNASKVLTGSANMTFNGTDLTVSGAVNAGSVNATTLDLTNLEVTNIKAKDGTASASIADSTGVMSLVANPVLSGGTANGVLYLNGSKVATSGSALTFDGTNLTNTAGLFASTNGSGGTGYVGAVGTAMRLVNLNSTGSTDILGNADILLQTAGNNPIKFNIASTEQMRLTSTGLGIGTSSPNAKLEVTGNILQTWAASHNRFIGTQFSTTYENGLRFLEATRETQIIAKAADTGGLVTFFTGTAPTERMRLDSSGNLGVNCTPDSKLRVLGATAGTGPASLRVGFNNTSVNYFDADTQYFRKGDGTDTVIINSSGNLGIGTSSPAQKLQVNNSTAVNTYAAFSNPNATNGLYVGSAASGNGIVGTVDIQPLLFLTSAAERMRLDTSGNLGIGTSSPVSGRLCVQAGTGTTGNSAFFQTLDGLWNTYLQIQHSTAGIKLFSGNSNSASGNNLIFGNTSTAETMRIDPSGNLGLGVTPSAWGTSAVRSIQVGNGAGFGGNTTSGTPDAYMTSNCYYDGSNWRYITSDAAMTFDLRTNTATNVAAVWNIAAGGTAGDPISFTQAMTLDASGNLLIGATSSPVSTAKIYTSDGTITSFYAYKSGGVEYLGTSSNHPLAFIANNTERARITSGGDLLVGTTSTAFTGKVVASQATSASNVITAWNSATTGDNSFIGFFTDGGTGRGSIDYNRAGGLVRYNTTSDYRAKDIIGPVQNVGATIDALKVYEGVMKGATQSRPMLIAHEAQAHAPYAVSGVKDEVNEDGSPKFQQIDVSSLVPLLLAEIQSLRARVAALEAQP